MLTPPRFARPPIPWVPEPDPRAADLAALGRWGALHGVQLPTLLGRHLRLNQGSPLMCGDSIEADGATVRVFSPTGLVSPHKQSWTSLDDFLDDHQEERASWQERGRDPKRMFYVAMASHIGAVLLDYSGGPTDPEVVVLEDSDHAYAGVEVARFPSYEAFFDALTESDSHDYLLMTAVWGLQAEPVRKWLETKRVDGAYAFGWEDYPGMALVCANARQDDLRWVEELDDDALLVTIVLDRTDCWEVDEFDETPPDTLLDAMVSELGGSWEKLYESR